MRNLLIGLVLMVVGAGGVMAALAAPNAADTTGQVCATAPGTTVVGHTSAFDGNVVATVAPVTVPNAVACVTYTQSTVTVTGTSPTTTLGDVTPPLVTWTKPLEGQTVSGVLGDNNCDAAATDNVGIDHVDFFLDGVFTNRERQAGYACQVNTANFPNGSHTLKATAFDRAGNAGSASITVTFQNGTAPPPTTTTTPTTTSTVPSGAANIWVSP